MIALSYPRQLQFDKSEVNSKVYSESKLVVGAVKQIGAIKIHFDRV